MSSQDKTVGEQIAIARRQHGWTQEELAERVGRRRETIAYWEIDRYRPAPRIIPILSAVLKIPVKTLSEPLPVKKRVQMIEAHAL